MAPTVTPLVPAGTRRPMECVGESLFTQVPWLFFTGVALKMAVPACHAAQEAVRSQDQELIGALV